MVSQIDLVWPAPKCATTRQAAAATKDFSLCLYRDRELSRTPSCTLPWRPLVLFAIQACLRFFTSEWPPILHTVETIEFETHRIHSPPLLSAGTLKSFASRQRCGTSPLPACRRVFTKERATPRRAHCGPPTGEMWAHDGGTFSPLSFSHPLTRGIGLTHSCATAFQIGERKSSLSQG